MYEPIVENGVNSSSPTTSPTTSPSTSLLQVTVREGTSYTQADHYRALLLQQTRPVRVTEKVTREPQLGQITVVQAEDVKKAIKDFVPNKNKLSIDPAKIFDNQKKEFRPANEAERKDKHSLLLIDINGQKTPLAKFFEKAPDGKYYILERGASEREFLQIIQELPAAQQEGAKAWAARNQIFDESGKVKQTQVVAVKAMKTVEQMSSEEKLAATIKLALKKLPDDVAEKLKGLLTPENLVIMTGVITVWAASHLIGAGEIADVVLLAAGLAFLGADGIAAGRDLYRSLRFENPAIDCGDEKSHRNSGNHLL
ncbi:MAG: hypothetical protein JNN15_13295 [Blastocatellia bacterium]|nr:hypothetical protein [Blastocatellia bacterium]